MFEYLEWINIVMIIVGDKGCNSFVARNNSVL